MAECLSFDDQPKDLQAGFRDQFSVCNVATSLIVFKDEHLFTRVQWIFWTQCKGTRRERRANRHISLRVESCLVRGAFAQQRLVLADGNTLKQSFHHWLISLNCSFGRKTHQLHQVDFLFDLTMNEEWSCVDFPPSTCLCFSQQDDEINDFLIRIDMKKTSNNCATAAFLRSHLQRNRTKTYKRLLLLRWKWALATFSWKLVFKRKRFHCQFKVPTCFKSILISSPVKKISSQHWRAKVSLLQIFVGVWCVFFIFLNFSYRHSTLLFSLADFNQLQLKIRFNLTVKFIDICLQNRHSVLCRRNFSSIKLESSIQLFNYWIVENFNSWIVENFNSWIVENFNSRIVENFNSWIVENFNSWKLQ